MQKIQCELCGSTEIIKKDEGYFQCEHCGCKYSLEQAKSLMSSVEITSGDNEKNRLIQNFETLLKLGKFADAANVSRELIKQFPGDYRGWWYNYTEPFEEYMITGEIGYSFYANNSDYKAAYELCPDKNIIIDFFKRFIKFYGSTPHEDRYRHEGYTDMDLNYIKDGACIDGMTEYLLFKTEEIFQILPKEFSVFLVELTQTYYSMLCQGTILPNA